MREPQINDRWQDVRGEGVTVTDVVFNRVSFLRDGYEHPCVYPVSRFIKEFQFVSWGMPE